VARLLVLAAALTGLLLGTGSGGAVAARAAECGLPDARPLWIDYAGHDAPLPQKPGLVLAYSSGTVKPAAARAAGAGTVFFDLNFNNRIGTPSAPRDPATIVERADRAYEYAVTITGCATPWIAENELFGAQTPTPWTPTTAQYRANVLTYVRRLAERGARVFVTIANPPYTGDEAAQWWRDLAASAVLVRQVYFTSPNVGALHARGPLLASRAMRRGMRALVGRFTAIGIPSNRVALELQFHSAPGQGGRERLQPSWKWFEIVKLQALAVRTVTVELGTHSIWSWGWATFSQAGIDPDKDEAVCVYLWVHDPQLCNGPAAAGPQFDSSVDVGQIDLSAGIRCVFPDAAIRKNEVAALAAALGGDLQLAAGVLLERIVLGRLVEIDPYSALLAERAFVAERFVGSTDRYLRALRAARLSRTTMRALLADRLRRDVVSARFVPARPSTAAVEEFHRSYADFLARPVAVPEPVDWLGGRRSGFALETFAPPTVFSLRRGRRIETPAGRMLVRPLGEAVPLGALSTADARPAIETALGRLARGAIYDGWLRKAQRAALVEARCTRDQLPEPAVIDMLALPAFTR
jgi:hypothetical protein